MTSIWRWETEEEVVSVVEGDNRLSLTVQEVLPALNLPGVQLVQCDWSLPPGYRHIFLPKVEYTLKAGDTIVLEWDEQSDQYRYRQPARFYVNGKGPVNLQSFGFV